MMNVISNHVEGFYGKKTTINGIDGYKQGDYIYFTIPKQNNEEIYMEQKEVGHFLIKKGYSHLAVPIGNRQGSLVTKMNQQDYCVFQTKLANNFTGKSHPELLADFHNKGEAYPYEPNYLSSYGKWKILWQNRIAGFENFYNQQYQERPVSKFNRLFLDTFPYLIGLSENALQYLQESEAETRYHDSDQPCITFQRYNNQLQQPVIWSSDLTYDHPVRDIAEYIRPALLAEDESSIKELKHFFTAYEKVRPLSVFSWRLLYARLLFPVHLFDFVEAGFTHNNPELVYREYKDLLEQHAKYERNLTRFYDNMDVDARTLGIPLLDW
ncbi:hypothetical protein [Aquibacillus salsiterrae]|uniref:Spore coat protein YutH n=1 Tax=Aquibacillus salsiterrae TaxID=2950439 RepID=A0A9X3WDG3_9BACI|nr:hypothetical protein [Aquibacillus salsiterrae]MDC3417845.1 hypothetical protein [Aquibacillus salsiterrae]